MLFSYDAWPTAMEFGMIKGIAVEQVISYFGELWFTFLGRTPILGA